MQDLKIWETVVSECEKVFAGIPADEEEEKKLHEVCMRLEKFAGCSSIRCYGADADADRESGQVLITLQLENDLRIMNEDCDIFWSLFDDANLVCIFAGRAEDGIQYLFLTLVCRSGHLLFS